MKAVVRPGESTPVPTPVSTRPVSTRPILTMDVGGSKLAVACGRDGLLSPTRRVEWNGPSSSPEELLEQMVDAGRSVLQSAPQRPRTAIVAIPGLIDASGRRVVRCANLPFVDHPLADELQQRLGVDRVVLEDDVNCGAVGEWVAGASRGYPTSAYVSLSTGVSSGLMIDGHVVRGASRMAGEIGHVTVVRDGRLCGCGRRGCLEAYCSGRALATRADEVAKARRGTGTRVEISAERMLSEAYSGDTALYAIVAEGLSLFRDAMSWLSTILDPDVIVIGGGLMTHPAFASDALRAAAESCPAGQSTLVRPAALYGQSVLVGALRIAEGLSRDQP